MRRGQEAIDPLDELSPTQSIVKVVQVMGNSIYQVAFPDSSKGLVELPPKFRNSMWIRRGGYVLIDTDGYERLNKLLGSIVVVIHDSKSWMKMPYWPNAFKVKKEEEEEICD